MILREMNTTKDFFPDHNSPGEANYAKVSKATEIASEFLPVEESAFLFLGFLSKKKPSSGTMVFLDRNKAPLTLQRLTKLVSDTL